ncbi:hypothetical protein KEF85_09165 [Methylomonas paludis]|uniref:Uncharacterized protein n=1 Tax=Methylomonas paludis TaxID=1173101 RepID=A0A975MKM3_9GAMM|nr:hypothetical protein [Methylomonas paludis]QWF69550.1 hypothetical protein KEF85_09165 [Methylomonas paludis]
MKKNQLLSAISASLLTMGAVGGASAHDILGGTVAPLKSDVFSTTCFSWGGLYSSAPAGEVAGNAAGFRFAVNLQNTHPGNSVTAEVIFPTTGNVNGPGGSNPNNVLPWSPAPTTASTTTTNANNPWSTSSTTEPDFTTHGVSPSGWSSAQWLPGSNGEYIITITSNDATNTVGYDFLGHCQTAATGVTTSIHSGQGVWITGTTWGHYGPTSDFNQFIDN